jgi:hypothetical protein
VGVGLLAASLICLGSNRLLKRAARRADGETVHTLYFLPLGAWGWVYGALGLFFTIAALIGIIRRGWRY